MAKKKQKKLDFGSLEPLSQNPFASLGDAFGITPSQASQDTPTEMPEPKAAKKPSLNIRLEKRKKGKVVTAIYNLGDEGSDLLKKLKQRLGSGGSASAEVVEIQGDHRDKTAAFLTEQGYKVRIL